MILVIGAAGKTGRAVTRSLVRKGFSVRAGVRQGSSHAPETGASVQPVTIDLATGLGLDDALDGVEAVYHLAPNLHPGEVEVAERVSSAATRAGVARVVFHSVLHPEDSSMPHHLRKAAAERVLRSAHPGATVLRPAAYHQNLVPAACAGLISVPYSLDAVFTNVDLDDVAAVATTALTTETLVGETIPLAGPERLTVRAMATIAADVLGRPVEPFRASTPPDAAEDLRAMFRAYDRAGLVGDPGPLTRLLGRRPTTWEEVLLRYR